MFAALRTRIRAVAGTAPRAYWLVLVGTLINKLGGFVIPLLTIYLLDVRGLSVAAAGGVVSVYGAGAVLASIIGGQLTDRLGRKLTMVISLFGGAIAMAVLGHARDLTAITALVGVVGLMSELYRPAVLAFVADVIAPAQRVHAYGLLHWVINIGFAIAAVVGGALAQVDFTLLFIADAVTMAAYGVIVVVAVPETRPPRAPARERTRPAPRVRSWLADREMVVFLAILFALALIPGQLTASLAAHIRWQGHSPAAYGAIMAVNGLLIVVFQPALAAWSARRDPSHVLVLAALAFGCGFAMHGVVSAVWLHAVAVVVWTLGEILESPTRSAIVAGLAPAAARGRYQGAVVMMFGLSQLASPRLGTWVWEELGPSALWGGCFALGVLVAIAYAVTAPGRRRRAAHPAE